MKFVKSLFLAVVCIVFVKDAALAAGYCLKGQIYTVGGCKDCPGNCYCPTEGYKTYVSSYPGCGGTDTDSPAVWVAGLPYNKGNRKSSWCDITYCPKIYPFSGSGAKSIDDCYNAVIVCSTPGKYIAPTTGKCDSDCPEGYACCPGRKPDCDGFVRYENVHYRDEAGITETCGNGTYSLAGASTCTPCPSGTSSGTGPVSECKKCGAGTCSSQNGFVCSDTNETGAKYCMTCPAGTYSKPLSSENGNVGGNTTCEQCTGRIIYENGLPVGCDVCPSGTYPDGSGTCQICLPGYFCPDGKGQYECKGETTSSLGSVTCSCDNGLEFFYTIEYDVNGKGVLTESGCKPCEGAGRYLDNKGCHECPTTNIPSECKVNTEGGIEGKDGNTCKFEESDDNTGINSCQISVTSLSCDGIYRYNSSKKAYVAYSIEARGNYYVGVGSTATDMQCKPCPTDKPFSDGGSGGKEQCYACGAGSCVFQLDGIKYCKTCSGGYACPADDGKAQDCEFDEDEIYGVTECTANTFSGDGASTCISCANGYVTTSGKFSYCRKGNVACYSANACKQQGLEICIGPSGTGSKRCSSWPSCIIEDKYNRIKTSSGKPKRTGSITWLGKL